MMLSCARYRVVFEAVEPLDLPNYLGSTLRGAFGHAFRAVACPSRRGLDCPDPQRCPYHLIFETSPPPSSEALRTHEEIPRPFVIAPADSEELESDSGRRLFRPGEEVAFELVLIGRAEEFFPHFVVALREVNRIRARTAVGRVAANRRARLRLEPISLGLHGLGESGPRLSGEHHHRRALWGSFRCPAHHPLSHPNETKERGPVRANA